MNRVLAVLLASILAGACAPALSDTVAPPVALATLKFPTGFKASSNTTFSRNYQDTECLDISQERSEQKLGFICQTRDPQFLRELGIASYDSLNRRNRPTRRPTSGFLVSTPVKQYSMEPFLADHQSVYGAAVDCDTSEGQIYRPTASCHVAIMQVDGDTTLYSNFVLEDHTTKRSVTSQARVRAVWNALVTR